MKPEESDILQAVEREVRDAGSRSAGLNLELRPPELRIVDDRAHSYCSEIRLEILKDGELDDVLEFFVYRDGQRQVTVTEAQEWVAAELARLLTA